MHIYYIGLICILLGVFVLIELVGNTPLLSLSRAVTDLPGGVEFFAKTEFPNPSGTW